VPDVVNEARGMAVKELQELGLDVKVRGGNSRLDLTGDGPGLDLSPFMVRAQSPDGGTKVPANSAIVITVR